MISSFQKKEKQKGKDEQFASILNYHILTFLARGPKGFKKFFLQAHFDLGPSRQGQNSDQINLNH